MHSVIISFHKLIPSGHGVRNHLSPLSYRWVVEVGKMSHLLNNYTVPNTALGAFTYSTSAFCDNGVNIKAIISDRRTHASPKLGKFPKVYGTTQLTPVTNLA